ncbi:NADP-dependent oxidoreductase domain-containing protein [Bombardia bombarda]|uniref:NADP-dependent oxidoreductase domain-containing protein n=1 Tax=Bombardia bombarda TaxID=252184 RepID=A0AA39X8J2_9PEZI|nr:NADP-dependent oxidoreductase domain-containing protein [Bombardia bombarda]
MATLLNGSPIPQILYGTARREGKSPPDVLAALRLGYRGLDTASSRHFHQEEQDGKALGEFLDGSPDVHRRDMFIQSKYAGPANQVEPWPYEIADDTTARVLKSVLRSARDLGVDVIDVYFLHTPLGSLEGTLEAWRVLERTVQRGGIRYLGIANVRETRLRQLFEAAQVKPHFVQNWFRGKTEYDRAVVEFCREHGLVYQVFGVFDEANRHLLASRPVGDLVRDSGEALTTHQALLQLLLAVAAGLGLKLVLLDGTTRAEHMRDNLGAVSRVVDMGVHAGQVKEFGELIGWA